MMKTYARVDGGIVMEIIQPFASEDGIEVPIELRFIPELVAEMVDISGLDPQPDQRWTYDGSVFEAPKAYVPNPAEILAVNTGIRDSLLSIATLAIAPLQDAVDLNISTSAEKAQLTAWKQYRVDVNRVDLTRVGPAWPVMPE